MLDLRRKKARQVRALHYEMTVEEYFSRQRDERIDRRFWNVVQASFYASAHANGQHILVQGRIDWDRVRTAAGRNLRPLFDRYENLTEVMATRGRYVEDWIHVFYATVFVGPERQFIHFMFDGEQHRWSRQAFADRFGVALRELSAHRTVYGSVTPPFRGHPGTAPSLEQIQELFSRKMHSDTPRTPDILKREYFILLQVLRRTLLPKGGFREGLTAIHQFLLAALASGTEFDIVDVIFAEIEDVICDSMTTRRQFPFAHYLSYMLAQLASEGSPTRQQYLDSRLHFPLYAPAAPGDGRIGQRAIRAIRAEQPPEQRAEQQAEDEALEEAEEHLPEYFYVSSSSDDSDYEPELPYFPPGRDDAEAGSSQQPSPPPAPTVTQSQVTQPDALTAILQTLASQQASQADDQRRQEERFAKFQEEQL